ncbi:holin family protein [Roseivivax sediminis]|uniref:Holin of 3TMs, for gene-transfer release n=1 Tax=Roseivivax sediminis TaxID=936889 RepID=A0A1I1SAM8_9RHOB|nr:holin family protein [Roseivivax sediminis]SFD43549.1 Holin of 3TMs, for gene-transfer release [Roseivivax sediminis]
MGLISQLFGLVFGEGRNAIVETAEVFRVNAEADAERRANLQGQALTQFAAEFGANRRSWFDRLIDGLNRVPRPAMALGTLALFAAAMVDPVWFAARMTGIALVPEPLWWLLGAIVSFYFGARHQAKGQEFRREIAATMAAAPQVAARVGEIERLRAAIAAPDPVALRAAAAEPGPDRAAELVEAGDNAALADWSRGRA